MELIVDRQQPKCSSRRPLRVRRRERLYPARDARRRSDLCARPVVRL